MAVCNAHILSNRCVRFFFLNHCLLICRAPQPRHHQFTDRAPSFRVLNLFLEVRIPQSGRCGGTLPHCQELHHLRSSDWARPCRCLRMGACVHIPLPLPFAHHLSRRRSVSSKLGSKSWIERLTHPNFTTWTSSNAMACKASAIKRVV